MPNACVSYDLLSAHSPLMPQLQPLGSLLFLNTQACFSGACALTVPFT